MGTKLDFVCAWQKEFLSMACLRMDPPFVGVLGTVCSRVKGHETIYFLFSSVHPFEDTQQSSVDDR